MTKPQTSGTNENDTALINGVGFCYSVWLSKVLDKLEFEIFCERRPYPPKGGIGGRSRGADAPCDLSRGDLPLWGMCHEVTEGLTDRPPPPNPRFVFFTNSDLVQYKSSRTMLKSIANLLLLYYNKKGKVRRNSDWINTSAR